MAKNTQNTHNCEKCPKSNKSVIFFDVLAKVPYFFFPEKVRWPFNQSKSKIVYFFFPKPGKKKYKLFFNPN